MYSSVCNRRAAAPVLAVDRGPWPADYFSFRLPAAEPGI